MESKTSAINIQVDSNVKKEATLVLTDLGLSMSSAVSLFLKQVVKKNGIPFEVTNAVENKKILDVVCALIMKDGKCLIARRNKNDHLKGKWEFPGGRRQGLEDEKKTVSELSSPSQPKRKTVMNNSLLGTVISPIYGVTRENRNAPSTAAVVKDEDVEKVSLDDLLAKPEAKTDEWFDKAHILREEDPNDLDSLIRSLSEHESEKPALHKIVEGQLNLFGDDE